MHAKFLPTSGLVRVYENDAAYERRDEFVGVVSVLFLSDETVLLTGGLSYDKKNILRRLLAIFDELATLQIRFVLLHRANGKKMPFGELIEQGEVEDLWKIDLKRIIKLNKTQKNQGDDM